MSCLLLETFKLFQYADIFSRLLLFVNTVVQRIHDIFKTTEYHFRCEFWVKCPNFINYSVTTAMSMGSFNWQIE